jgi:hypothetical protein
MEPRRTKPDRLVAVGSHTAYRRSELQAIYEKFKAEIEKLNPRVDTRLRCGPNQISQPANFTKRCAGTSTNAKSRT